MVPCMSSRTMMLWAFFIISRYFASLSLRASRIFFFSEMSVTTTVPPFFASSGSMSRAWRVQAMILPPGRTSSQSAQPFPRTSRWIWRSRQTCPNSSSVLKSERTGFPTMANSGAPRRAASGWLIHSIVALRIWNIPSGVAERIAVRFFAQCGLLDERDEICRRRTQVRGAREDNLRAIADLLEGHPALTLPVEDDDRRGVSHRTEIAQKADAVHIGDKLYPVDR